MATIPERTKDGIHLRPLRADDFDRVFAWHNDPQLYETLTGPFRYVSRATEEEWFRQRTSRSSREISLAICVGHSERHIGNIYLKDIDWISRNAVLAIFIGDASERSKGHGVKAIRALVDHAFNDLGLKRLYLHALDDNVAAIRAYEKVGFEKEGVLRRHAFKGGRFVDLVVMGLCVEPD